MERSLLHRQPGPFTADQLGEGDPYELSNGHAIECVPAGRDHSGSNLSGAEVLDTDPDVEWAGVDAGYSPEPRTLRAPDVAVGMPEGEGSGWIPGSPPLALEYAAAGQDEEALQEKIRDLLRAGTRFVWVVRLSGPRRVEVYESDRPVVTRSAGEELVAPGVLRNPVPVEALYDRHVAHQVTLRNLLQREGYESLAHVKHEGRAEGERTALARGVLDVLVARGFAVDAAVEERVGALDDLDQLRRLHTRAVTAATVDELLADL